MKSSFFSRLTDDAFLFSILFFISRHSSTSINSIFPINTVDHTRFYVVIFSSFCSTCWSDDDLIVCTWTSMSNCWFQSESQSESDILSWTQSRYALSVNESFHRTDKLSKRRDQAELSLESIRKIAYSIQVTRYVLENSSIIDVYWWRNSQLRTRKFYLSI